MVFTAPHSLGSQRCSLFRCKHGISDIVGVVSGCDLLQACRGGKFDYGVESEGTDGGDAAPVNDKVAQELMEKQVREREGKWKKSSVCLLSLTES